jgi:UDP-2,3-diacylglucosamine pyrophosphatase LpxH/uncharacterized protein YajQ (UPF0234 family)
MDASHGTRRRVRTAFISDVHLGARECRAEALLEFLHRVHMDELYLVGDIVDVWSLKRSFYWPQRHHEVLRTLLAKARHGTRVIYVPGNHDVAVRDLASMVFGKLEVHREIIYTTARGQRLLVVHGDEFEGSVHFNPWLTALGSGAYDLTLHLNRGLNGLRRLFGYPYWSLATYIKSRVGNAVRYVQRFELAAAQVARHRGTDGIVCGHIHRPCFATLDGIQYCNTGDWVENCTALIEDEAGDLQLWRAADWSAAALPRPRRARKRARQPRPAVHAWRAVRLDGPQVPRNATPCSASPVTGPVRTPLTLSTPITAAGRMIKVSRRLVHRPHEDTHCMPSFDVVSKVDAHELTNAVDQARRELEKRYDFRGTTARLEHAEFVITQFAASEYQLDQLLDILRLRLSARGIDPRCLELGPVLSNLAESRRTLTVRQGIEQLLAKQLVTRLKESKLKVDAQIQGDKLRVTGKKRDDLQTAIAMLRKLEFELPLQFENFRD